MKRTFISLMLTGAMLLSLLAGIPLRTEAAEKTEPGITLTVDGGKLTAVYTGSESNPTLVSAGYDRSGQMQSVETKTGKKAEFTRKNGLTYRVYALAPDTAKPLCEAGIEAETEGVLFSGRVEVPCIDGAVADAAATAVRQALNARMALEAALALDPAQVYQNEDELARQQKIVEDAMEAYDGLMDAGAVLWAVANDRAEKEEQEKAALSALMDGGAALQASQEETLHWAQELTKKYDSIQSNKKLGALGEMLGCDARTAYQQLTVAQEILRGNYEAQAKTADNWVKGLTVVKTGAKVGMLVCGTIATGGAAGMLTAGEAVGVAVGTVDVGIEIAKTGATLVWGDDGKITKKFEDATKPISAVTSIYSLLTFDVTKASPGECMTFFWDLRESLKDNYGTVMDELKDFQKDGDTLTVEVTSTRVSEEEMKKQIEETEQKAGEPDAKALDQVKDQMDENRKPLTDETLDAALEELLKEEGLLEEGQALEDFNRTETRKDFEEEIIRDLQDNSFDGDDGGDPPPPSYPMFYDNGPGVRHRNVYWTNALDMKVGLFEHYYDDVLEAQAFYDDDGKLVWTANYKVETGSPEERGQITQRTTYTNGNEVGSIISTTHYFYTDALVYEFPPEEAIGKVSYTEHQIVQPYHDEETDKDLKTTFYNYGLPHCRYDYEGNLVERDSGDGVYWQKLEEFDHKGNVSIEIVDNGDGTHTRTDYYTEKPVDWPFDPTGHEKRQWTNEHEPDWSGFLNMRPSDGELVREETWQLGFRDSDHVYETDGDGNQHLVCYTRHYGFDHFLDHPKKEELPFDEQGSEVVYP